MSRQIDHVLTARARVAIATAANACARPERESRPHRRSFLPCICRALGLVLALLAPVALASVGVNKTFTATNVSAGQSSTLTVILLNNNPASATAVAFTDTLPGTVVVANPPNIVTGCGGTLTGASGAGSFSFSGGTIPAAVGATPGQCSVTIDVDSLTAGVFINTIPVGAVASSQGTNPQAASATLTVAALQPLTGGKAFVPANLHGGGNPSTVTITLTNPNPVPLTNAAFTDTLPGGVAVAPTPDAATTCVGGTVTATAAATTASLAGGTIPASGSCTISFDVIASTPNAASNNNVTNTIGAGAVTTSQGVVNTSFNNTVRLQTGSSLAKSFAPGTITTGGISTLTITINNYNASAISPLAFTDTLPSSGTGSVLVAPTPNVTISPSCNAPTVAAVAGTNVITVTGGSLAGVAVNAGIANTTCTITVGVIGTSTSLNPNTFNNTIPAGVFGTVNHGAANGSLQINAVTSVTNSKAFAPNTVLQGGTSTLTVTLNNSNAAPATLTAVFTDSLASMGAGFTVAASPAASMTCGGVLTAVPGATSFSIAIGGTIPAASSCTITVPVQVAANAPTGGATNTVAQGVLQTNHGNTQSAINANLNVNPVLSVSKAFAPSPVASGTDTRLTITLTRAAGAVALSGLAFTDTLPAGHVVSATPNLVNNCGGSVTAAGNTIVLAGGALAGGVAASSCTILVNVTTPVSSGTSTNTIAANAVTSTEGFTNRSAGSANITRAITTVTLNKSFVPATVAVGGTSTLTINVLNTNANAIALTAGALTDNLPVGMVLATPPVASTTCPAGVLTAVAGASSISMTSANIAANATCRIQVNVVANASGNLINTFGAGTFTSAQGVTNPLPASATLSATGSADLGITKTDGTATATPGTTTTYTIVATNAGPNAVAGATVADTPPAGVTFTGWTCVASAGSSCNPSGSGAINQLVTLLNGGNATFTVTALVASGATGSITNTATATVPATVVDPVPANNSASDTDTLTPVADLSITKTDGSLTAVPGNPVMYTIVASNAGPSAVTGATVADTLPGVLTGATWTCVGAGGGTCPASGAGNINALVNLPVGATATFTLSAVLSPAATGTLANTATVTVPAGVTDPTPANNTATDTDTLAAQVSLVVVKTDGSATYAPGGTATYTVTVTNGGPSSATNVTLTDALPAGTTLSANATCVPTGTASCGTVTGAIGQTAFGTTGASIAPGGVANKLVFTVPVAFAAGMVADPIINTATATNLASIGPGSSASGTDSDSRSATVALSVVKTDGSAHVFTGRRGHLHSDCHQRRSVGGDQRYRHGCPSCGPDADGQRHLRCQWHGELRHGHGNDRADEFRRDGRQRRRGRRQCAGVHRPGGLRVQHDDEPADQHGDGD